MFTRGERKKGIKIEFYVWVEPLNGIDIHSYGKDWGTNNWD